MTETQLKQKVKDYAAKRGVVAIKIAGGPRQRVGIADLLMVFPPRGRLLAMELKAPGKLNNATASQHDFLARVAAVGAISCVVDSVDSAKQVIDTMYTAEMKDVLKSRPETQGPQESPSHPTK